MKTLKLASLVACITTLCTLIAFNLWLPRAYHFMRAVNATDKASNYFGDQNEYSIYDSIFMFATFKFLSKEIFLLSTNKCDMEFFMHGQRVIGKNEAVTNFVIFNKYSNLTDNDLVNYFAQDALKYCNPDIKGDRYLYPPLIYAIFLKDKNMVELLIKYGAKTNIKISSHGKPIDGMTSLEFTKYIESKAKDINSRAKYEEIEKLIEKSESAQEKSQ